MELTTRTTCEFIVIKTDEIETTLFKSDQSQIIGMIKNLLDIADELSSYTDVCLLDYVAERE